MPCHCLLIAQIVLRSPDTVVRVLKRFLVGGLDAVPRQAAPGRARRIPVAWEAELLRVIELDSHEVGQDTANWTTERLAGRLPGPAHRGLSTGRECIHGGQKCLKKRPGSLLKEACLVELIGTR
jgi:transposase